MKTFEPFPKVMGQEVTREEVIEALRDNYKELCALKRRVDRTFVRYPDFETILDHIETHGIPPKI